MEKISKEELFEKLKLDGVSAEDLEKVSGGENLQCLAAAVNNQKACRLKCDRLWDKKEINMCNQKCGDIYLQELNKCKEK